MSETKAFHIGDVLSASSGRLVSPSHMDGIYRILNWMTGDNLFTHQLPRAMDEAAPLLKATFPDLTSVEIPESFSDMADMIGWLETLYPQFGETVEVPRLADAEHTRIDPISELKMMRPDMPIIAVNTDDLDV